MIDWSAVSKVRDPEDLVAEQEASTARQYLQATDWYVVRNLETGTPVPADVALARKEARTKAR